MKHLFAAAIMSSCAVQPAVAQECIPAEQAASMMIENGFQLTFSDADLPVFLAEDGDGSWVFFVIHEGQACALISGQNGAYSPRREGEPA